MNMSAAAAGSAITSAGTMNALPPAILFAAMLLAAPLWAADPALAPVDAALSRLAAPEEPERLAAAKELGQAAPGELAPAAGILAGALESEPSRLVRERLAWAIGLAGEGASPLLPRLVAVYRGEKDRDVQRALLRSFGKIAPTSREVVDLLLEELASPVFGRDAVPVFGALGPAARPAVPALTAVLGWEDSSSRISAAIALGAILAASPVSPGGADPLPTAVAALGRALGDPHLSVRLESAKALGQIGPAASAAIPALIAVLELEDGETADRSLHGPAAWALGEMGKLALPAAPALRRCFENDRDPYTRKAAEAALRKLGLAPVGKNLKT